MVQQFARRRRRRPPQQGKPSKKEQGQTTREEKTVKTFEQKTSFVPIGVFALRPTDDLDTVVEIHAGQA
tara:strand:+ start:407 stop:613 length:207 start_codon:yes stop_codon:yes gene_type:complete